MEQINYTIDYFNNLNRFKLLLLLTLLWTYINMYAAKCFAYIIKILLCMPDKLLSPIVTMQNYLTTDCKNIKILHAQSNDEILTNKLKLFMQCYWKPADDQSAFNKNGFNIKDFTSLVKTNILYCTYLLTDSKGKILLNDKPEDFFSTIKQFIVQYTDGKYEKTTDAEYNMLFNSAGSNKESNAGSNKESNAGSNIKSKQIKKLKKEKVNFSHLDFDDFTEEKEEFIYEN